MISPLAAAGRAIAAKILIAQLVVTGLASAISGAMYGMNGAISGLAGGVSCILPFMIFSWFFFRTVGASQLQQTMRNIYRGQSLKLLISIGLFCAVYQWSGLILSVMLLTYAATTASQWFVTIFVKL
ncbi:ATP synthase subunit I [Bowmanella sp. JS7-9]|uniref:ATP synthase subunit I n=1 Tax=Pseudobowmanella zhangzhouensis TaxID=1537679 RepID=A0ABW1XSH1_9ALTE|nr:ATP synthase subunit I [Bowmanella sp. JS7-9]TBX24406.1 hypothetical protein TK45_05225 [Bowmanella sp. JS7-9]